MDCLPPPCRWETDVPLQLQALRRAMEAMDRHLESAGATPAARDLGRLVLEELGTNVLKYAGERPGRGTLHLVLTVEGAACRLELEDDGPPFNPCVIPEPDSRLGLAERGAGGWGLALVRRLVSGMEHVRHDDRNRVTVWWPRDLVSLESLNVKGRPE